MSRRRRERLQRIPNLFLIPEKRVVIPKEEKNEVNESEKPAKHFVAVRELAVVAILWSSILMVWDAFDAQRFDWHSNLTPLISVLGTLMIVTIYNRTDA